MSEESLNQVVEDIWKNFDKDGNGFLDKHELRAFLSSVNTNLGDDAANEEKFEQTFKEIDADSSNTITKEEMKAFLAKSYQA
jgi:Ca2+-binding EF-hand superfamily protein